MIAIDSITSRLKTDTFAGARVMLTAVLLLVTFWSAESIAKSRTCLRLERQLASLSNAQGTKNPKKALQYSNAIIRQKTQIRQANRQLRRKGCLSATSIKIGINASSCRRLKKSLGKMQSNLRKLRTRLSRFSGKGRNTSRERRRIKRALAAKRCNNLRPVIAANRSGVLIERRAGRRSIVEQIYGDELKNWDGRNYRNRNYNGYDERYPGSRIPRGGTYRTLCVRSCDGYYFPISFSTTPRNFDRDADSCSAKCPGTETELYYHATRGESSKNMVSYSTQEPYTKLENAFSYRKAVTAGCGCKFSLMGFSIVAGDDDNTALEPQPEDEHATLATPTFKIDAGEDPETLANERGSFVPTRVAEIVSVKNVKSASGKRKIRVVGETFFPTQ